MKMYNKNGGECNAMDVQITALEKAGWSKTKVKVEDKKPAPKPAPKQVPTAKAS